MSQESADCDCVTITWENETFSFLIPELDAQFEIPHPGLQKKTWTHVSSLGLRTATVFTVYGHRNMATVTVPWPNLSTQSRFSVGTVECRICRRYAAAYGRALTVKLMPQIPKLPYDLRNTLSILPI